MISAMFSISHDALMPCPHATLQIKTLFGLSPFNLFRFILSHRTLLNQLKSTGFLRTEQIWVWLAA